MGALAFALVRLINSIRPQVWAERAEAEKFEDIERVLQLYVPEEED